MQPAWSSVCSEQIDRGSPTASAAKPGQSYSLYFCASYLCHQAQENRATWPWPPALASAPTILELWCRFFPRVSPGTFLPGVGPWVPASARGCPHSSLPPLSCPWQMPWPRRTPSPKCSVPPPLLLRHTFLKPKESQEAGRKPPNPQTPGAGQGARKRLARSLRSSEKTAGGSTADLPAQPPSCPALTPRHLPSPAGVGRARHVPDSSGHC